MTDKMEPLPENIRGERLERHTFKHEINWGHVAGGVGLLVLAWVMYQWVVAGESDDDSEENGLDDVDVLD
ncbi:hypothetical protein [Halobacterium sp. KA-6]|uniref:hypothetical protein n=1 Tax=Halobacterium sp. KA-6 TaxID=2896368 RepID=UPI001E4FB333|nr:hypothetical protein [Halobacterium sp. KA-6]MCD2205311.1 hypothetical protein [Halobacterium sp. KA-6]